MRGPKFLLTDDEMAALKSCETVEEWDAACKAVTDARGGSYPNDWFTRVLAAGLSKRVLAPDLPSWIKQH